MESIKEIYKIGYGPSSSHTMGPRKASEDFLTLHPKAHAYRITLYGSLAATGKGHLTGEAITEVFAQARLSLLWKPQTFLPRHPNAMLFEALDEQDVCVASSTVYSVGGGSLLYEESETVQDEVYPYKNMEEALDRCYENGMQLWELVEEHEGKAIWNYLEEVWTVMKEAVRRGLDAEGILPGQLKLARKAHSYYAKGQDMSGPMKKRAMLFSYALAVSEENAGGGRIVTAPTCGACGILPGVLYYQEVFFDRTPRQILQALATAGFIGAIVKKNASISGAEVGCQGEVGVACAMASGAATQLSGGSIYQIEYSAEMGLEHHLGLTCDPVAGLVQIPCIERNAFGAARALNHNTFAILSDGRHRVSFDDVVEVMKKTGHDLPSVYKETSQGGLALFSSMPKKKFM